MGIALTPEMLLDLPDIPVRSFVTSQFAAQLKASPSVRPYFFPSASEAVPPKDPTYVDDVAVAFVCSAIARSSLYGFAATVNGGAADGYWQTALTDANPSAIAEGQALYDWAFPAYCQAGGVSFADFMRLDAAQWAEQLSAYITSDAYIDTTINKIPTDPGWLDQLYLSLYKINRLDPAKTAGVLDVWRKAYPSEDIVDNWDKRSFVREASFADLPETVLGDVNKAIAEVTTYHSPPADTGAGGWSQQVFGWNVAYTFLGVEPPYPDIGWNKSSRARQLGFLTGKSPVNLGHSSPSCFRAGTPVHLADGRTVPIDDVAEGDHVLAKDGGVAVRSGENVVIDVTPGDELFGFEHAGGSEEPFFSAGHLFWTAEGWKAVNPAVALALNRDRPVGALEVGNRLFRLSSTDPVAYDEVEITAITKRVLTEPGRLYSLHLLDGPRSYHAHGYLVGSNYPVVTIRRLADGLATLTEHERRALRRHLEPVVPMLEAALGPFVSMAVTAAFDPPDPSDHPRAAR